MINQRVYPSFGKCHLLTLARRNSRSAFQLSWPQQKVIISHLKPSITSGWAHSRPCTGVLMLWPQVLCKYHLMSTRSLSHDYSSSTGCIIILWLRYPISSVFLQLVYQIQSFWESCPRAQTLRQRPRVSSCGLNFPDLGYIFLPLIHKVQFKS